VDSIFNHIFLHQVYNTHSYNPLRIGGSPPLPQRDRDSHYAVLRTQWQKAIDAAQTAWEATEEREGIPLDGIDLNFSGSAGFPLNFQGIEDRRSGIRLRNCRTIDTGEGQVQSATLFFPRTSVPKFRRKLDAYHTKTTSKGRPRNADCVDSIDQILPGTLASIWTDPLELLPQGDQAEWCELWLDTTSIALADTITQFRAQTGRIGIELDTEELLFPERVVLWGRATRTQLKRLVSTCSTLAELRRAKESAHFFLEADNAHQTGWVERLASRLVVSLNSDVSVCVLDTGANNGHRLLRPILANSDCHAANPVWHPNDSYPGGHGTEMCGLVAYGELASLALGAEPIKIGYHLESVKVLEHADPTAPPQVWGSHPRWYDPSGNRRLPVQENWVPGHYIHRCPGQRKTFLLVGGD